LEEGDKVAVGLSGGKDGLTLLVALYELKRFYPKSFQICAITLDMGFETSDYSKISSFCENLGIEYKIISSRMAELLFQVRKETNPCSLCARMRRAALLQTAEEMGCTKLALGHHSDDVIDTFLMNLFFEGRIGTFSPSTCMEERRISVIRPLVLTSEKEILSFVHKNELPILKSPCPEDKHTERENIKNWLKILEKQNKGLKHRIYKAIEKANINGFTEK
jgi:tRNA(Ile)-lysidine synthase TilS/MesJ